MPRGKKVLVWSLEFEVGFGICPLCLRQKKLLLRRTINCKTFNIKILSLNSILDTQIGKVQTFELSAVTITDSALF